MKNLIDDLAKLERVSTEMHSFREYSLENISKNTNHLWAMRYGVLQCIQISINIICTIVSRHDMGTPASLKECIRILQDKSYISNEISDFLLEAIILRNNLLFDYSDIYDGSVYDFMLKSHYFIKFAEKVSMI